MRIRSVELFKASWAILRRDKELLVLPILSGAASILTVGAFAIPLLATLGVDSLAGVGDADATPMTYVLLVILDLVLAFITVFFNSALVAGAHERMEGGDPTLGSALAAASARLRRIGPWALVSATVSSIIRQIQERAGFLGALFGFLGGVAWSAVTFLVLPILVIEDVSVRDAVKRSSRLLRNTWGERLTGHFGMGIVGLVAAAPFVLVAVAGMASGEVAVLVPALAIAVVGVLAVTIVVQALSVVYQTALYRFATGRPVSAYRRNLMTTAFRVKDREQFS